MALTTDPNVTFIRGNGRNLSPVITDGFLSQLPRPLLVVEDADHSYETTSAVLKFFHPHLRRGEYIVVEDGITSPGVRQALIEFFQLHGNDYAVDPEYCDYFGYNATWCMNGFLRRE
jgi:cephalosporin hydroxylase